jgi:hypothetical protein
MINLPFGGDNEGFSRAGYLFVVDEIREDEGRCRTAPS